VNRRALASRKVIGRVVEALRELPSDAPAAPPKRDPRVKPGRIDTYNSHPATGLTIEMLLGMYREAERGYPVRQFDCFDDMIEIDASTRGLINGRIDAVAGCEWVIKPGRDDAPSRLAAEVLDDHLRNRLPFRDFLEHHLFAPHYGLAGTNTVWDLVDGYVAPIELINVPARRFASPDQDRAHEIWMNDGSTARELVELEAGLWAITRYRHRNPWAGGLMRTVAWWSMFKRWAIRDWQVFAEMFGIPLVIGFYDESAGAESRAAVEDAVKMIGEDGYAVLSDLVDIVIKETARSGDSSTLYPKIADRCDDEISKLIAGSTTAAATGGTVGSYNLGAVHESRAYKLSLSDARLVEQTVRNDIAAWFCRYNGFDRAAPPRLKIQITRDSLERARTLQIIGQVVELDQDQIREEFTLRTPAAGRGVKFEIKQAPGGNGGL
jgi:phage gp29-like protein